VTAFAEFAPGLIATPPLRPQWFRPLALLLIVLVHAAVFVASRAASRPDLGAEPLEVMLSALGDGPQDQQAQEAAQPPSAQDVADAHPQETPPPAEAAPASPSPAELTVPPPQIVSPSAPPVAAAKPKPVVKPKPKPVVVEEEEDDQPTAAEVRAKARAKHLAEVRAKRLEEARVGKAQEARHAMRRGAPDGAGPSGVSRGDYAGLLLAEVNRHRFYPSAARAEGATGGVGVAFTIGPSGRVVSQAITRSSGHAALDAAARAILSAVQAPPPPGGRFSTNTIIRFHLD
jgi:periplasmic protein TonB